MPPDVIPVDYDPFSDAANAFPSFRAPASDLPQPLFNDFQVNQGFKPFNKLFGTGGETRHVLWPEQMVRRAMDVVHGASQGENQLESKIGLPGAQPAGSQDATYEPNLLGRALGMTEPWRAPSSESGIAKVQDLSGLMAGGPLIERPGTATLGSGMTKPNDRYLIPALKVDGKVYKGERGGLHPEIMPEPPAGMNEEAWVNHLQTSPTVQRGFVNHKGHFLDDMKAGEYAVDNGLVAPEHAEFVRRSGLASDILLSDSEAGTGVSALAASKAPPFYSAVEAAVRAAPGGPMSPEQWRGYLSNRPGVKAEELDWVGLPEGKKVTKQEMLDHVNEHGVRVKEVEKKGRADIDEETARDRAYEEVRRQYPKDVSQTNEDWFNLHQDKIEDHAWHLMEHGDPEGTGPKFSEYQLPGGENYREKLFTLPNKTVDPVAHAKQFYESTSQFGEQVKWENLDPTTRQGWVNAANEQVNKMGKGGGNYQSSHWDEPNVLAHVRINDREIPSEPNYIWRNTQSGNRSQTFTTEAEANAFRDALPESARANLDLRTVPGNLKTLHLEELQSDWHQAGRKSGYQGDKQISPHDRTLARIREEFEKNWVGKPVPGSGRVPTQWEPAFLESMEGRKLYDRFIMEETKSANIDDVADRGGGVKVPDAPFKTTWPDLVLKRMIRDAAEGGYDAISWTPGEAQAARYDLSKHYDAIGATKRPDGTYMINGKQVNGSGRFARLADHVAEDKLADHVGKDLAEKIVKDGGGEYSGLDLKVGGEGMKGFYDKMLVDKANALAKKFGGKVEYKRLQEEPEIIPVEDGFEINWNGQSFGPYAKREMAERIAEQQAGPKVPVLRLTPQMKDTALRKGFPLFSAGVPFPLVPVDHDPFSPGVPGSQEDK